MRTSTPRELGLLVRERRQDLRLSQAELAARAGVSREWLVAVEKGHARAELGKLLALLAELGLSLDLSPDADTEVTPGDQPEVVDLDRLLDEHDARTRRPR
ncbi:MAG TPA: helix-turn-helix domain-containing protein [Jatrophihabitans sp.]|jgi:y4mF family transcriptional regulator|nr:helix-turn-helix domain-containing protein [Jatrophihabitans sp.]